MSSVAEYNKDKTELVVRAKLMGNAFSFSAVSEDQNLAQYAIDKAIEEISRIEALLTTYKETSVTSMINSQAGIQCVKVTKEIIDLLQRCTRISDLTQGAFDITFGSVDKSLWNFDKTMTKLPDPALIKKSISLVNYKNIIVDTEASTVFLSQKGMRIGFGGIGKGYAAHQAKIKMQEAGITSGLVNASGDMTAWGKQANGSPWKVGIAHPDDKSKIFSTLSLNDMSIATSGDYEKFVIIDGKKYSHTINPRTGYPVKGIKSVTIICPNAELCDALTTPVMIKGVEHGLHLINNMKNISAVIFDEHNKVYLSKNLL
jgi:FAD:protein FMN transferase